MFGFITKINVEKQYGFLSSDEVPSGDVFFHRSVLVNAVLEDLQVGDEAEFRLDRHERGLRAADMKILWADE